MENLLNFCEILLIAYNEVSKERRTLYVRVNDVREKLGISVELMQKRLNQIWDNQFKDDFPYNLSIEVDLFPKEHWHLRKKKIFVNNIPANIMQFHKKLTQLSKKKFTQQ